MSGGFSIENLDVWHWWNVQKSDLDISDHFQAIQTEKYGRSNFFFNSLSARLTNHPYMAFPNLEPPLPLSVGLSCCAAVVLLCALCP